MSSNAMNPTNDILRVLVRLDDAVRPLVEPEDITFTAARELARYLGADRCAYACVEADEDACVLTGNYTDGVDSIVGRYRFRQFGAECLRLLREGRAFVVEDAHADPRVLPEDRASYDATRIRAMICVPIRKSERLVAAMAVHMSVPRRWTEGEVEIVQQVASRCWESIERARVERERESLLEAAEAANRAKDEFLAMLGHELRNPLAPIHTALQLMKLRGDDVCERERTVIERQVTHLTRLVDDLLDVSRIAQGKVELKLQRHELAPIVTQAIEMASPLLESRAHVLRVAVPARGLAVTADAARLTQVVSNLLTNAGKYTPHGGEIVVTARREGNDVVLSVRDSGVGMTAEVLARAFEMFVQAPQTIERAQGGLGLGLTVVKSLVEGHGGRVEARSEGAGAGSELLVRLPAAIDLELARPASEPAPRSTETDVKTMRVLVVDDNEDAADMLASVLTMRGFEVEVAHDGPKALQIANSGRFDAAMLDIGLPVMDGYELAGRLRQLASFEGAPLVAVTGYGQESDRRRAMEAGFLHHLVKPVDFAKLHSILDGLPEQARRAS